MCRWLVTCKFSLKFPFIEIGSYQLIMEREAKEKRGVFVQKKVLIIGAIFFLITIVVVALLTHYSTNTVCTRKSIDGNEEKSQQSPTPTPQPTPPLLDVRLPKSIQPLHYNLSLQPFFDNFTFHGTVAIQIECLQKANNITLHANNITLRDESTKLISTGSAGSPRITSYNYDSRRQFLVFQLSDYLQVKGVYELSLEFDGSLNDKLVGFYRSKYDNDRWMATTQFEPTDARRAFPCFDEPGLKANFSVSLIRSKQDISISNMPQIKNETQDNNWVKDVYETTPKMSTYLLAFVITNFSYMDSKSQGDINFRVYSRHEAISQTKFASEFGPKVLDFYDQYFNVNYPLPKQDMIAIPDFGAGAMENWGLITYRETALLYDENVSSVMNKERVAIVIAHELAHQWFGNLVSPTWWDYLWLNEGFAAYMERFCTDKLYPKWKMIERFASIMQSVLKDDSLKSSHPVYVPVQNPDQINEIFDSISYQKGASIIRMMVNFLGEDVFKNGLTTYFNDKKYGNAVQDELWRHMTEAAGKKIDVKRVMDTWTVQTGYPVVTVTRNTQDQSMTFTQKIFHLIPDNSVSNDKWEIPITFTSKSKSDFSKTVPVKWINNTESSIKVTIDDGIPPENEWIILNIQQTGYYRVNYEKKNWEMITTQLNNPNDFDKIHVLNRAQLIDDSFSLARAGQLDYEIALKLSKYLENEKELVPWQTAIRNFGYIDAMLKKTEIYGLWQKFVLKLTIQQYNANNFQDIIATDDNHIEVIFQGLFVAQACQLDVEDCVTKSVSAFNKWIADSNTNKLSPSLRDTILCKAIEKGGINEWDNLWIKYNTSNVGSEKVSLLNALTCTQQPWIINKMLNMILNPNTGVRSQDSPIISSGIAGNKVGRYLLFDYVRANLKELTDKFGQAFLLPKILKSALANFNTQFELNQLNQFIKDNKPQLIQVERSIRQIVESTESNIKWMNDNYEKIRSWLESEI